MLHNYKENLLNSFIEISSYILSTINKTCKRLPYLILHANIASSSNSTQKQENEISTPPPSKKQK